MKTTIKVFFWLILLALIGLLGYSNQEYFLTKTALIIDLKREGWHWTLPGIENAYYFGGCFIFGLFLAGFKMLRVRWRLNSIVKAKNKEIDSLQERISHIKTELEVFQHDPYIKKELDKQAEARETLAQSGEPVSQEADNDNEIEKDKEKGDEQPETTD